MADASIYSKQYSMLQKKVIMKIPSVYTANAFRAGEEHYVGAGSETEKIVHLYDLRTATASQISGCPGGMMSFIPVPGEPDLFITIQGLFPPFIGAEAGLYLHRRTGEGWETRKVLDMPFSHRCEILTRSGKNYLLLATVSKHKENPADWFRPAPAQPLSSLSDFRPLAGCSSCWCPWL